MTFKNKTLKYAIVGSSGYIAPRHIKAINDTNGLVTSLIDINFTDESLALFPKDIEKFSDIKEYLRSTSEICDYIVICSPNFLHEQQISIALDSDLDVICEKPVALNLKALQNLEELESSSKASVNTILQLRLHPSIQELKMNLERTQVNNVKLVYVARRNEDYFKTWKGKDYLSGGMITNVGIHYLDLMTYLFGRPLDLKVDTNRYDKSSGHLSLENAEVDWLFSFDQNDILKFVPENMASHRSIFLNNLSVDFSQVPEDLHTTSYRKIISGQGFTLQDAKSSIALIDRITIQDK